MSKIRRTYRVFHGDDISLELSYPDAEGNTKKYIDIDEETLIGRFEIFCRIFFNHILKPKEKREFRIQYNEESGEWEYLMPSRKKPLQ